MEIRKNVRSEKGQELGAFVKLLNIKKLAAVVALGLTVMLGASLVANAQGNNNHDRKEDQKVDKKQEKVNKQQAKVDQQRQTQWTKRNTIIVRNHNTRVVGGTYYNVQPTVNISSGRYRVYRGGRYYNTDNRGADMLRQAVNEGYRQGFAAGRSDYGSRRNSSWSNNSVYRSGTYGYTSGVDRGQYQYYFQQGFQRGYQDGSNSRFQNGYTGSYEYGYEEGGSLNVLGTILNSILNLQSY